MRPKMIIRCRCLHCEANTIMNGPEIKVAVCNEIEKANSFFDKNVITILDKNRIPAVLKNYRSVDAFLAEEREQDIILYMLRASIEDELLNVDKARKRHKNSRIILVAEDSAYMKEAYKVQPFRYLYLSDPKEVLQEALISAVKSNKEKKGIVLDGDGRYYYILLKDILYIEALGDEIGIYTLDGSEFILRMPLKHMLFLKAYDFIRCSRQRIVNARYIEYMENTKVMLVNDEEVVISERERKNVVEHYAEYIFRMRV